MTAIDVDTAASEPVMSGDLPAAELAALARPGRRPGLIHWRERNLIVGALLIAVIVLAAILAPAIAPRDPQATDYTARLRPPGAAHLFGTDNLGRDIFSRVLHGARIDLQVGLISVLLPFVIGVALGCLAGYYGGRTDSIVMRIADVIQAFPFLILIIARRR